MPSIANNASRILKFLVQQHTRDVDGPTLAAQLSLNPQDVNDAVTILVENNFAEWQQWFGTAPYDFGSVSSTSRGKYEYERSPVPTLTSPAQARTDATVSSPSATLTRPPAPVGSPYGFQEEDWEVVVERKASKDELYVVLGHQFASTHFETVALRRNVERAFQEAVAQYNAVPGTQPIRLIFTALGAGYGEHLFNEIARDIISADVAVFDTSDMNPNVMLEMGVALTWGVRVLAIKREGCDKPPSDVSGQTWADYTGSCESFADADHSRKLFRMVERAARKKGRA